MGKQRHDAQGISSAERPQGHHAGRIKNSLLPYEKVLTKSIIDGILESRNEERREAVMKIDPNKILDLVISIINLVTALILLSKAQ